MEPAHENLMAMAAGFTAARAALNHRGHPHDLPSGIHRYVRDERKPAPSLAKKIASALQRKLGKKKAANESKAEDDPMLIERKYGAAGYGVAVMERDMLLEEIDRRRTLAEGMFKPRVGDKAWFGGEKVEITAVRPDAYVGGWKLDLKQKSGRTITVNPGLSPEFGSKNDQQTRHKRQVLLRALHDRGETTETRHEFKVGDHVERSGRSGVVRQIHRSLSGKEVRHVFVQFDDERKTTPVKPSELASSKGEATEEKKMVFGRWAEVGRVATGKATTHRQLKPGIKRVSVAKIQKDYNRLQANRLVATASKHETKEELRRLESTASLFPEARARRIAELRDVLESDAEIARELFRKHGQDRGPVTTAGETQRADYGKKSIGEIAAIIRKHWKQVNYGAKPYLDAMSSMDKIDDKYGADDGRGIVAYFLSNANSFRGPEAKIIKSELKRRLGRK